MRQEEIVTRHLQEVGTITSAEALSLYRITDLPKRISVLRQEGHAVDREYFKGEDGRRYCRYILRRLEQ